MTPSVSFSPFNTKSVFSLWYVLIQCPAASGPFDIFLQLFYAEILNEKRTGASSHLVDPFHLEVSALGLAGQPAKFPTFPRQSSNYLRYLRHEAYFSGHPVKDIESGKIGQDTEHTCYHSV